MMTLENDFNPYSFCDEIPPLGSAMNDRVISGSGLMRTRTAVYRIVDPRLTATTTRKTQDLSGAVDQATSASSMLSGMLEGLESWCNQLLPRWQKEQSVNVVRSLTKEDRARLHINTFLGEVYCLARLGETDAAGYKIFDFLDRVLCDGFFAVCDEILSKVEVEKLPTPLMRSFLSITAPAKKKLPSRAALYKGIEKRMLEERGPEKTRRIIGNLA